MKQFISCLCALALVFAPIPLIPVLHAQTLNTIGGALTASATACSAGVVLPLGPNDSTGTIQLSGTFVGTVSFYVSSTGGAAYTAINGTPATGAATSATATAAGLWTFDIAGKTQLCAYASAYTSGTVNVGITSGAARANTTSAPIPQALSTTSTPTFAGSNLTTGSQFNGVTSKIFVAADFTTSGVGTASEAITGLAYTLPASTALSVGVHCAGTYLQNIGNAAVTLGVGFSGAPTNAQFQGIAETAVTAVGMLGGTAITTATTGAVVTMTPGGTATNYYFSIDGFIENPSLAAANTVTFYARTATAADTVTIRRGSYCSLVF